jgi:hypothetical protein
MIVWYAVTVTRYPIQVRGKVSQQLRANVAPLMGSRMAQILVLGRP